LIWNLKKNDSKTKVKQLEQVTEPKLGTNDTEIKLFGTTRQK